MAEPLEEIEFLARSPNRIRVLEAVAAESHTRRDLQARTEASQPTLARILSDFEDRQWVEKDGARYEATPLGELVAAGFTDLVSIVETETRLRSIAEWLPTDHLDMDLRGFDDADITRPTRTDPSGPLKRALELSAGADSQCIVSYVINYEMLETVAEAAIEGSQSFRAVISPETIEMVREDDTSWARFEQLVAAENAEFRVADEAIPFAMGVADETVYFLLRDEEGILRALLESDDSGVRSQAMQTVEEYWERAETIDSSVFDQ
ncbi:helix-turn-helix transcriptional regulator [Haloferax namakaokahaiae]|uniref:Helix-turn-helix transcriptional regulator n=1 Tax=Haloferax namakaokahaiae TaxID=1748331 RepID=A0ABD5ZF25_9EURY